MSWSASCRRADSETSHRDVLCCEVMMCNRSDAGCCEWRRGLTTVCGVVAHCAPCGHMGHACRVLLLDASGGRAEERN